MNPYAICSIIAGIFLIILGFYIIFKKDPNHPVQEMIEDKEAYDAALENSEPFDEAYFEAVKNGEPYQHFLILGGMQDCALIRSLLFSEGIPSYTENEHINQMYGGVPSCVTGVFAIKLYILCKDYDKAYDIVSHFANSKSESFNQQKEELQKKPLKAAQNVVTGLFFAPYPVNAEQKGMGITILPKIVSEQKSE